jgi:hypothetical protein
MEKNEKKLRTILLLSLTLLSPVILVTARRKTEVLIEVGPPTPTKWVETPMPNGFTRLDAELVFPWSYDGELVGSTTQYVNGIIKYREGEETVASLFGYGIYTASGDLSGTVTYTGVNQWNMDTGEIWGFSMRVVGGTGDFEGIKGIMGNEFPNFMLYVNFNPWE